MTVAEVLAQIREEMAAAADERFAAGVRNFFKEQVDPWGVRTANLQRIVQRTYRAVKHWPAADRNELCEELWRGKFEEGVLVSHVCRKFAASFSRRDFKLFERWIDRHVHNWAHCDGVSSWLVAACVANEPELKAELPRWSRSKNRWKRRASAVSLLQEAKKGRSTTEILETAERLKADDDDMVRKGVGWLLKEAYPARPEAILAYVQEAALPRIVVRYAAEKMIPEHRAMLY